jgi:hypothetical protein
MVTIRVTINDKQVLKKLKSLNKFMEMSIPELTNKQADEGAAYAASIAPRDTGALIQAIGSIHSMRGTRSTAQIVSRTPPNIRNNNPRNYPYQIVLEMGKSVNVRGGRHQRYMHDTMTWLEEKYPRLVSEGLTTVIKQ